MSDVNMTPSTFEHMDEYMDEFASRSVMPLDPQVSLRYPCVDPMGKCSVIDMEFAYRMARINAVLQVRSKRVRERVNDLLTMPEGGDDLIYMEKRAMLRCAAEYRSLEEELARTTSRARSNELRERMRMLKEADPVLRYSLFVTGLEYLAGIKHGPLPDDVRELYGDFLHEPIEEEELAHASELDHSLTEYGLEFQNFDNIVRCQCSGDPTGPSPENATAAMAPYARATAALLLDALFDPARGVSNSNSRLDLICVDGMTVRERLYAAYLREREEDPSYLFHDYLRKNDPRKLTYDIVSAALMAEKRVEMFVPDQNDNIPETPVQLLKTGYTAPVERVTLNAWERFFSKWGFYKEKTAKALDYERTMEARRRVQVYNMRGNIRTDSPDDATLQRAFYPEPPGEVLSVSSGAPSFVAIAACAMLADGRSLADIMDPAKDIAEKRRFAAEVYAHAASRDNVWIAEKLAAGTQVLAEQFDALGRSIDITDPNTFRSSKARPLFFAAALADHIRKAAASFGSEIHNLDEHAYEVDPYDDLLQRCRGIAGFMQPFVESLDRQAHALLGEPGQAGKAIGAVAVEKFHIHALKKAHAADPNAPLWTLAGENERRAVESFTKKLHEDVAFQSYVRQVTHSYEQTDEVVRDMANGTFSKQMHISANTKTGELSFKGVDRAENAEYLDSLFSQERELKGFAPQKPKPPARTL